VGVVLDGDDRGRAVVLAALEVDQAVHALVAAAPEARRDDALVVAAALLLERDAQRLLGLLFAVGDLRKVGDRRAPAAGGRRLVVADAPRRDLPAPPPSPERERGGEVPPFARARGWEIRRTRSAGCRPSA